MTTPLASGGTFLQKDQGLGKYIYAVFPLRQCIKSPPFVMPFPEDVHLSGRNM